jgi:hypothetical protein
MSRIKTDSLGISSMMFTDMCLMDNWHSRSCLISSILENMSNKIVDFVYRMNRIRQYISYSSLEYHDSLLDMMRGISCS